MNGPDAEGQTAAPSREIAVNDLVYRGAGVEPLAHEALPEKSDFNPVRWVHYVMRGRYHWAILLGAVLAAGAGYYQYQKVDPLYQASGSVRIRSTMPTFLYNTGKLQNYDGLMNGQVAVMRSERIADMAMTSEEWRELGIPFTPEEQEAFQEATHVYRAGNDGDTIVVTFKDEDPRRPKVAVTAMIEAYQRIFNETDPTQEKRRLQLLDERRLTLTNQLNALQTEIRGFGDAFGPDGVRYRYQAKITEVRALEQQLRDTRIALDAAKRQLENGPPAYVPVDVTETPAILAIRDDLERNVRRLELMHERLGEDAPVAKLEQEIDRLKQRLAQEIALQNNQVTEIEWRAERHNEIATLEMRIPQLQELITSGEREIAEISRDKNRLERLETEAAELRPKLDDVESRLEQIKVESVMGDRLEVLEYGRAYAEPVNQDEPMRQGMMGAMAGGGVGIGIVLLVALMNPTLRRSDDLSVAQGGAKVLGMLPYVPDKFESAEQAYFAGQCVHQIRMLLQLEGGGDDLHSFVITGPVSGAGKTSLTTALGLSYASAGARTLLVDFDLIGAGLSDRLAVGRRKRLGRLLQEEGLVSASEIEKVAGDPSSDKRLGEKLVELGLITQEDIERVLQIQQRSRAGLLDVFGGEPLTECVAELPVPNLSLLSVGNATAEHVSRVGRKAVRRFLKETKEHYDVVLIDTGPVPGSIETSLIAAEVDRTIVTVSRGDHMRKLNECTAYLRKVGARVSGVVFNRADPRDMTRSAYSMTSSTRSVSQRTDGNGRPLQRLGPIATATVGEMGEEVERRWDQG